MSLYRVHVNIVSGHKLFLFFLIIDIDIFTRERIPHLQNLCRRRRRSRPSLRGLHRVAKKVSFDDITVVESPTVCTSFTSGYDATQTFISFSYRSYERFNIYIRRLEPIL